MGLHEVLGEPWSRHIFFILNHDQNDLEGLVQVQIDETVKNGDTASGNLWRRALAVVRGESPPSGLESLSETEARAQADAETARGNAELAALWTNIAHIVEAAPATTPPPVVPEVAIAGGADATEGEDATFALTATPAPTSPLTVDVTVTEAGGYATSGARQVTIPAGGSATLSVATVDDAVDEPASTVTATFEGREGTFALDGETTTAMLGMDYAQGRWLLGVTLLQSLGTGGYDDRDATPAETCANLPAAMAAAMPPGVCNGAVRQGAGAVESTLTAAVPYAAFQASERLKLWGAAGYGVGEVTLAPETGGTLKTDIAWTMAELGLRGTVLAPPPAGTGPTLAVTSDALWARTTSEQVLNGLAASNSAVTRLRLGLEGQWAVALETLGQLTPTLAVGARHDGGDAETGFGVELGGGLAWHAPRFGLALTLEGRTLLTHRDEAFKDQGVAAAFTFDPDPTTPRGAVVDGAAGLGGKRPAGWTRCSRRTR